MKSFAVVTAVLVTATACASAGTPLASVGRATPSALALSTDRAVHRSFPDRLSAARLPSADRSRLSGTHSAKIRLCVAPDGAVQSLELERPSGSAVLDRALTDDIKGWKYAPYAAPAGIRVCERITVSYVGS